MFSITRDIKSTDETIELDKKKLGLLAYTRKRLSIERDMKDDEVEPIMKKILAAIYDELVSYIIIFYFKNLYPVRTSIKCCPLEQDCPVNCQEYDETLQTVDMLSGAMCDN